MVSPSCLFEYLQPLPGHQRLIAIAAEDLRAALGLDGGQDACGGPGAL
jgi:hypothetical protein